MAGFIITGLMLLLLFLISFFLKGAEKDFFLKENGFVELATAFCYFVCAAMIVYKGGISYLKKYYYVFIVILSLMLRELDFHKKFTTMSLFKSRFYISDTVPLAEKIVGVIVVFLLLYLVVKMIHRHTAELLYGLKNNSIISFGIFVAGILLLSAFTLDGIARRLKLVGIEISSQASLHAGVLEEVLELGIPMILIVTFSLYFKRNKV